MSRYLDWNVVGIDGNRLMRTFKSHVEMRNKERMPNMGWDMIDEIAVPANGRYHISGKTIHKCSLAVIRLPGYLQSQLAAILKV
jgi:hypothetical protein